VNIDILNNPLFVDDKNRPFRRAVGAKYAIFLGYFTMRPKIAQQGVRNPFETIGPSFQTRNMIYADAQNLDISLRKLGIVCLVRRNLMRSNRRPGQGEKRQHGGCSPHVLQGHILIQMAG